MAGETAMYDRFEEPRRRVFDEEWVRATFGPHSLSNSGSIRSITLRQTQELQVAAKLDPRRRSAIGSQSPLARHQLFVNNLALGTYIRPHRHSHELETFVWLRGEGIALIFNQDGVEMWPIDNSHPVLELPAGVVHSVVVGPNDWYCQVAEVKPGPFLQPVSRDEVNSHPEEYELMPGHGHSKSQLYAEAYGKSFLADAPPESDPRAGLAWLSEQAGIRIT